MKDEIHIGKIIRKKMKEEGRAASWLAKKMNCDRSNVYKIFEKSNIDVALLLNISKILSHDFLNDISVIFKKHINQ